MSNKKEQEYIKKWKGVITSTTPGDMEYAQKIVKNLYKVRDYTTEPEVLVVENPIQGALLAHLLDNGAELDEIKDRIKNKRYDDIKDYSISGTFSGAYEGYWLGYNEHDESDSTELPAGLVELRELAHHISWMYSYTDVAIICEKALEINLDNDELHSYEGAALVYKGGESIYAIKGYVKSKEDWEKESAPYRCSLGRVIATGNFNKIEEGDNNE